MEVSTFSFGLLPFPSALSLLPLTAQAARAGKAHGIGGVSLGVSH